MTNAMTSNITGVHGGLHKASLKVKEQKWKFVVVTSLVVTIVIGLLILGMQQHTETKLFKVNFILQSMKTDAENKMLRTQQTFATMTMKLKTVESQMLQMQTELETLRKLSSQKQPSSMPKGGKTGNRRGRILKQQQDGLENLLFGRDLHYSNTADDPISGFRKNDLL